jgi:hypothetical protein
LNKIGMYSMQGKSKDDSQMQLNHSREWQHLMLPRIVELGSEHNYLTYNSPLHLTA